MSNVENMIASINAQFDVRVSYETEKNAENDSIKLALTRHRKSMTHERVAQMMIESNVDVTFINRQERMNARYNEKSIEKVANIARFLASADRLNHYTNAILKSAIALTDANLSLTHTDACAACSSDAKVSDKRKSKLITHYCNVVAANTASTQSSSSINALQMFHLLVEKRDDHNKIAYTFNNDHALASRVRELL